jgi:hypothetical protein
MRNDALHRKMSANSVAYSQQHNIDECVKAFENIYEYLIYEGFWEIVDESRPWALASTKKN